MSVSSVNNTAAGVYYRGVQYSASTRYDLLQKYLGFNASGKAFCDWADERGNELRAMEGKSPFMPLSVQAERAREEEERAHAQAMLLRAPHFTALTPPSWPEEKLRLPRHKKHVSFREPMPSLPPTPAARQASAPAVLTSLESRSCEKAAAVYGSTVGSPAEEAAAPPALREVTFIPRSRTASFRSPELTVEEGPLLRSICSPSAFSPIS